MPTYPYFCGKCGDFFDVIKPISMLDDQEVCKNCDVVAVRTIARVNFNNAGDWKPTFNPAFGKTVRSRAHQREILAEFKDKGKEFIEIGNEPVEKIHRRFDDQRQAARDARWSESTEKIMHEALR